MYTQSQASSQVSQPSCVTSDLALTRLIRWIVMNNHLVEFVDLVRGIERSFELWTGWHGAHQPHLQKEDVNEEVTINLKKYKSIIKRERLSGVGHSETQKYNKQINIVQSCQAIRLLVPIMQRIFGMGQSIAIQGWSRGVSKVTSVLQSVTQFFFPFKCTLQVHLMTQEIG